MTALARPRTGAISEWLPFDEPPSLADGVTLASYGLGLWWCLGGPTWAGLASIVGDELDGRIARVQKTTGPRGNALDWGADVALTPLAALRLGRATNHVGTAVVASPFLLYAQASLKAKEKRPVVGSLRAAIMVATMLVEAGKKR